MMKAIDVVLLPSEDVMRQAISINNKIKKDKKKIQLNFKNALPHISLAMGCVEENNINKVNIILQEIAHKFPPIPLKSKQQSAQNAWIEFEKNIIIEQLHISLMDRLSIYLDYSVCDFMFSASGQTGINRPTIEYVEKFAQQYSFDRYIPHMTIDAGNYSIETPLIECTSNTIAIFHLGNYCTCARQICSFILDK